MTTPLRVGTKTLAPEDYDEILVQTERLADTRRWLDFVGAHYELGHQHRYWEYGRALRAACSAKRKGKPLLVLDVGAGASLVGPALSYVYNAVVHEVDPDAHWYDHRVLINEALRATVRFEIMWHAGRIDSLPLIFNDDQRHQFDAVLCVSVLEHVPSTDERTAWQTLASFVRPGGVLYITVDCVPQAMKHYVYDNLRAQNFTLEMLKERVDTLLASDPSLKPMGEIDFTYHGDQVFDYTFFNMTLVKQ